MLDRQLIRTQPDLVKAQVARKGLSAPIDEIVDADSRFRALKARLDDQRAEQNRVSKEIGMLMGQGKREEAEQAKAAAA